MLKVMEKNRVYIWRILTIVLFGITGLVLVPVVKGIVKIANLYPRAFKWVSIIIFACIGIYGFLFARNWNARIVIICMGAAIAINSRNTNSGQ